MAFSSNSDGDSVLSAINITPLVDVMLVLLVDMWNQQRRGLLQLFTILIKQYLMNLY